MAILNRGGGRGRGPKSPVSAGIIVLNKPSGPTSRELVDRVARLLPRTKVGHAGTLDPLASGILIICVGTATRLTDEIQDLSKSYRTVVRLGARSDTDDALGSIVARVEGRGCRMRSSWRKRSNHCAGRSCSSRRSIRHSKIKGERAYDLARAGRAVALGAADGGDRPHRGAQLRLAAPGARDRLLEGNVHPLDCSRRGRCARLRRLRAEARAHQDRSVHAGESSRLQRTLSADSIGRLLRPSLEAVAHLRRFVLDEAGIEAVMHGRTIALPEAPGPGRARWSLVALVDRDSRLVALAEPDPEGTLLQPRKVLIS